MYDYRLIIIWRRSVSNFVNVFTRVSFKCHFGIYLSYFFLKISYIKSSLHSWNTTCFIFLSAPFNVLLNSVCWYLTQDFANRFSSMRLARCFLSYYVSEAWVRLAFQFLYALEKFISLPSPLDFDGNSPIKKHLALESFFGRNDFW